MPKKKDLTGCIFGRLTVLKEGVPYVSPGGQTLYKWLCKCSCGVEKEVLACNLRKGDTKSCGCLQKEITSAYNSINNITHGKTNTPEYKAWVALYHRCNNPKHKDYKNYGGRGIQCRFTSFQEFLAEVGLRPSPKHSIDRIDNNGHYEPRNLRWVESTVQNINRRVSSRNTSGTIGVSFVKQTNKWKAQITFNGSKNTTNLY